MIKKKIIYLTDIQLSEFKNQKLLNDPIYRKLSKKQNFKKIKRFEEDVEKTLTKTVVREKVQSEEIFRKSIIHQLEKKLKVLKQIILTQRSTEWREFYLWLKDFHNKRVEPCLDKNLFSETAQLYLWGGSDDDGVLALEHAELIQKIYHTIQYGRHDLYINIGWTEMDSDKAETRIKEIVDSFYEKLNKNISLKQKFIDFIQQFDLYNFMCTPDFECFFLDWWDYYQLLIQEKRTDRHFEEMQSLLLKQLRDFPSHLEPFNLLPRLHRQRINLSPNFDDIENQHNGSLCLSLDLPIWSEVPIEHVINEYLHGLSHYFAKYSENHFSLQKRAIEISQFQRQFQNMYHQTLKSSDPEDLNIAVVEILYLKWSDQREDQYNGLQFFKELISFFEKNSDRIIDDNFTQQCCKAQKERIMVKTLKWSQSRHDLTQHENLIKGSINKEAIPDLYVISTDNLRKKLKRSSEAFECF